MTIEKYIAEKTQQKADAEAITEAVTLRLPSNTVATIDELSLTIGVTRQEVIAEFVKDSLKRALDHYKNIQNIPDHGDQLVDSENGTNPSYFFLNTNKGNNPSDHADMVSNGIAAAFYDPWKYKIDNLRKGDVVFLYESGVGIVGVGKANGETEKLDKGKGVEETYQQKLTDYKTVRPLSAREIKKLTGTNMRFLQTMFKVNKNHGALIEQHLE